MGQDSLSEASAQGRGNDGAGTERLGDTLRREREKKGLSHAQVFEMTRLRPGFIDALENEDWGRIPDPAFIRGFVLTYAKALGLGESTVLDLYARAGVPGTPLPRLSRASERRWKSPALFVMILLCLTAVILYLVAVDPSSDQGPRKTVPVTSAPSRPSAKTAIPARPERTKTPETAAPAAPPAVREEASIVPASPRAGQEASPQAPVRASVEIPAPEIPATPQDLDNREEGLSPDKVLIAHVREETWVRIVVDDQEAREYILPPGSRREWKARRGFDLLLGNAGGVDLDFGGERLGTLGPSGKVRRLRLPREFRASNQQD